MMKLKRKSGFEEQVSPVPAGQEKIRSASADMKHESLDQETRPFCLEIIHLGRKKWEFPWSTFYMASITEGVEKDENGKEIDEIILHYVRFEVTIKGLNLGYYRNGIHEGTLKEIRVLTDEYRNSETANGLPFVTDVKLTTFGIK